jgi:hypothetical protein
MYNSQTLIWQEFLMYADWPILNGTCIDLKQIYLLDLHF